MAGTLKQITAAFAYFASGFTLRDLLSYGIRKLHTRRERRMDDKIVAYLVLERKSCASATTIGYGQPSPSYYRSSRQIADALKLESVDVLLRLERMEGKRVSRPGTKADQWTATKNELHDDARRPKRFSRLERTLARFKGRCESSLILTTVNAGRKGIQ